MTLKHSAFFSLVNIIEKGIRRKEICIAFRLIF